MDKYSYKNSFDELKEREKFSKNNYFLNNLDLKNAIKAGIRWQKDIEREVGTEN